MLKVFSRLGAAVVGMTVSKNKTKIWRNDAKELHREDGPAIEYSDGAQEWWLNGQLHRKGGPAISRKHMQAWYVNGLLHREDGPAIEHIDFHGSGPKAEYWLCGVEIFEAEYHSTPIDELIRKIEMIKAIEM